MTLETLFQIKERNSTVKIELLAGVTTFMTMSYILAVNPLILSVAGLPIDTVFTATVLASIFAMLIMAFAANLPIALAPAMGLNAYFAYTVCLKMGYPYQLALTAVFCEGILFCLMSFFNIREAIVDAIPLALKKAIVAGIGLFIAFIGLQSAGIVVANPATLVSIGTLTETKPLLALLTLIVILVLFIKRIKGAFLIGMFVATFVGIPFGITVIPENFSPIALPSPPLFFDFMWEHILTLDFVVVFFTFLFLDLFDTVGTLIGVAHQAGLIEKNNQIPRLKQALLADALGTTAGAILGTSTVGSYVESAAGVAEGGRTGLTTLVTAGLFLLALFLSPLFMIIPSVATAPVLIMVGFLMISPITEINFSDYAQGIPAFLCILLIPMSYSIAEGIVFGVIFSVFCMIAQKQIKQIPTLTWVLFFILSLWIFIR